MQWLSDVRSNFRLRWLAALLSVCGLYTTPVFAVAGTTQISAEICRAPLGSTIQITSPKSDSTVDTATIAMKGTVSDATQITVTIDGNYSETIPLGASDTSFNFNLNLTKGTHTIKLVANDVCQIQNSSDSVIVTFSGASGNGVDTPTSAGGVLVGVSEVTPPAGGDDPYKQIKQSPVIGPVLDSMERLYSFSGLDTTIEQGGVVASAVRVGAFAVGVTTLTFTSVVLQNYAMGLVSQFDKYIPSNPFLQHQYHLWILRTIGGIMVLGAIFV